MSIGKKNNTLNLLKGIASFAVVMLHCGFPGVIGKVVYGVSRFAVPFFFAVSGYFAYNENDKSVISSLPRKIKHILILFLGSEIIYFLWHTIQYSINTGSILGATEWIASWFEIGTVSKFVIFQTTFIGDVSWFLVALILCYASTYLLVTYNLWKKSFALIPVLLLTNIVLGELAPLLGIQTQWYWCSNFWLLGFPCYAIGYYIRLNERMLKTILTDRYIIIILVILVVINLAERVMTDASQLFISNIPFMIVVFVFCLKYPDKIIRTKFGEVIRTIGEKYAFGVYILHPVVRDVFQMFAERIGVLGSEVFNWALPVVVFVISIILYSAWDKGVEMWRNKAI